MSVDVKVDIKLLEKVFTPENTKRARGLLTRDISDDTFPFVPRDTGKLSDEGKSKGTNADAGTITWSAEYAAIVYDMDASHIHRTHHPQATSQWVEASKKANGTLWEQYVLGYLLGGAR